MAGKPPEVKILGDASGAKKASKDAASALDEYADALARAAGLSEDSSDKFEDSEEKVSRFGKTADATRGRVGDFAEDLKSRLGPAGEIAGDVIDTMVDTLGKIPPQALAAGAGIAVVGAALIKLGEFTIGKLMEELQQTDEAAALLQTTGEEASKTLAAFEKLGVGSGDLSEVLEEFGGNLADDRAELEQLGLVVATTKDGQADLNATLSNAIELLHQTTDPLKRAEIGSKLFGEQWFRVQKAIEAGGEELEKVKAELGDLDFLDGGELERARNLQMAMAELQRVVENVAIEIGTELAPFLATAADAGGELAGAAGTAARNTDSLTTAVQVGSAAFGPFSGIVSGAASIAGHFGRETEEAGEKAEAEARKVDESRRATEEAARAKEEAEEKTRLVKEEVERYRQALDRERESQRLAEEALRNKIDAVRSATDAAYAQKDAEDAVFEAQATLDQKTRELTEATNTYGAESHEAKAAQREADAAARTLERSYLDLAARTAEQTIKQQELGGEMLSMQQKKDIQVAALDQVLQTLQPGSPLYNAVVGYREQLAAIPTAIETRLQIYQDIAPLNTGSNFNLAALAEGGPAQAGKPYVVGEEGPELFIPKASGTVIPNDGFTSGGPAPSGMWGQPAQAPQPIVVQVMVDKRELGRAVVEVQRSR